VGDASLRSNLSGGSAGPFQSWDLPGAAARVFLQTTSHLEAVVGELAQVFGKFGGGGSTERGPVMIA
jgi:hypothetical protein